MKVPELEGTFIGTDDALLSARAKIQRLEAENSGLRDGRAEDYARIQMLVNFLDEQGLLSDRSFTFPDGLTWEADKSK